jgi:hypothetical protein
MKSLPNKYRKLTRVPTFLYQEHDDTKTKKISSTTTEGDAAGSSVIKFIFSLTKDVLVYYSTEETRSRADAGDFLHPKKKNKNTQKKQNIKQKNAGGKEEKVGGAQ